jgi:S-adenosylmethionine decarboxylase
MGETFGLHLMLDGYECDRSRLSSEVHISEFLDGFPVRIGMTKLMPPHVSSFEDHDGKHAGLSGFVLIAESHVSIHTFPSEDYVSVDVFSCKPFDVNVAEREIVRAFGIKRIERNILDRGVEYPADAGMARQMVSAERQQCGMRGVGT